jgi:hypothetical protein
MRSIALAVLGALASAWPAAGQEPAPPTFPAELHPWRRFKPGTSARYRLVQQVQEQKQEGEMIFTLHDSGPDAFVVRVKVILPGFEQERAERESVAVRTAEEPVRVGDRERPCVVWTSRGERGTLALERRAWIPPGRGLPLRLVSTSKDEELELRAEREDEELTVAGKTYSSVRLRGRMKTAEQGEIDVALWMAEGIPGGVARMETSALGRRVRASMELVEIQEAK